MEIKKQTGADFWTDEAKVSIPANRITKSEKLREKSAYTLATKAQKVNALLHELKEAFNQLTQEVIDAIRFENDMAIKKDSKGNFTWYNFDRSIKIEANNHDFIDFDETALSLCKEKLYEFLDEKLSGNQDTEFIAEIVRDAFSNTKGKVDVKKVMPLLKYESKVKSEAFAKAMTFLRDGIRKNGSKIYSRVSVKNAEGKYESINLNFSSI